MANSVFSGKNIAVYLRIDSIFPTAVVSSGESLVITGYSNICDNFRWLYFWHKLEFSLFKPILQTFPVSQRTLLQRLCGPAPGFLFLACWDWYGSRAPPGRYSAIYLQTKPWNARTSCLIFGTCTLLQAPTVCSVSPTYDNCSASVSFVRDIHSIFLKFLSLIPMNKILSNRTFRSSELADTTWISLKRWGLAFSRFVHQCLM